MPDRVLISDQVSNAEIDIILRELDDILDNGVKGDVVELGCYVGTTSIYLAKGLVDTDKTLYLYDSFVGLPEKTKEDNSPAGLQFKSGELSASKKQLISNLRKANVPMPKIKKAWFDKLSPEDLPTKISFAFLDGDYYSSIKDSLHLVWPNLADDATVIVDDYSNEALPGAGLAVDEWLKSHDYKRFRVQESLAIIYL